MAGVKIRPAIPDRVWVPEGGAIPQSLLDLPISEMTFHHNKWITTRVRNVLGQNGIHTLGQLLEYDEYQLHDMRNLGAISLANIKVKLEAMGLKLKEPGW